MATAKKSVPAKKGAAAAKSAAVKGTPTAASVPPHVDMSQKTLWVVSVDSLQTLISKATAAGITSLAIRTSNDVAAAITAGHAAGLKVFGWRWPNASATGSMVEAKNVVALFAKGLDGYYMDIEGAPGEPYDWDQKGLEAVATKFCQTIRQAANGKTVGLTSHFRAAEIYPNLPWSTFAQYADVFLPQSYWRSSGGKIKNGVPAENYDTGLLAWTKISPLVPVVPMGGELTSSTAANIAEYGQKATGSNRPQHYYTHDPKVTADVWTAIKKA